MSATTHAGAVRAPSQRDRDAALRLGDAMGRLVRTLRRSYVGDLGPASASALVSIVRAGPIRMGELAELEGVTPAALSRVVTGLRRDRLVRRTADPQDRRSAFVVVTDRGRDAVTVLRTTRSEALARRMRHLSVAERDVLLAALPVLERLAADAPG